MAFGGRLEAFFTVPSSTTVTATNSGGSNTSVSLTAGAYTPTTFLSHLVARLNAVRTPADWTGTLSTGPSGTGLVTLNCPGATITKTGGTNGVWDGYAYSTQSISGDGYVELTSNTGVAGERLAGFTSGAGRGDYTINFALSQGRAAPDSLDVYENGSPVSSTTVSDGDTLRITRSGSTISYQVNGATIYTSATSSSGALIVDTAILTSSQVLERVKLYDNGTQTDITWTSSGVTIADSWALTFTTAEVGTVLGFAGNIASRSTAATGTTNARGLWLPDCPLSIAGHPSTAPVHSDLRLVESPTGAVIGHKSSSKYRHTGLVYSHVPLARYREASATYDYASWEAFLDDTQYGDGHTWFSPASKVAIYWDNAGTDAAVGADSSVTGWYLRGVEATSAGLAVDGYTGLYRIEIPEITSAG